MKKLLNLFLAGLFLLGLALVPGCAIFKKRSVDKEQTSFSQTSEQEKKKDSTGVKKETTKVTETEEVDTVVKTKGGKFSTSTNMKAENLRDSLVKGMTLLDNNLVQVKTVLDTTSGKLRTEAIVKPQDVPVKIKKKKETVTQKEESSTVKSSDNNKVATEQKSKKKATVSEPKGLAWLWGIVVAVTLMVVGGIIFYFWKKRPG